MKIIDVRVNPGDSAFLVDDGETAILCDTGFAFTGYQVADNIRCALGERQLDYIFLTHSHYDHAAGVPYIKRYWPQAKVVAGEYAAKIFAKPSAKALMRDLDGKLARTCGINRYEDLIDELAVDITVSDGDIITAGTMKFTVLNLPGHTKCSVGYYSSEWKLLICCESLGTFDGGHTAVPACLVGYDLALKSIEKVEKLDIERIVIPHFGFGDREVAERYIKAARDCTVESAEEMVKMLRQRKPKEEILDYFKKRFYYGYTKTIYPIDAMELNTRIMIDLLEREFDIKSN